jgi:hypothetical protein
MRVVDALISSFYKKEFYRQAINVSVKLCVGLIIFIAFLTSISVSVRTYRTLRSRANLLIKMYENNEVPDISIKDGILSVEPERIFVKDLPNLRVIIDVTGETEIEGQPVNTFLITETNLYHKVSDEQINRHSFKEIKEFRLNRQVVEKYKHVVIFGMVFSASLFSILFTLLSKTFQAFLFGVFTYFLSSLQNKRIKYMQAVKITVFCLWPASLLSLIVNTFRPLQGFFVLYIFVVFAYILFAIHSLDIQKP